MTYRQIIFLKRHLGMQTVEMYRRFPQDRHSISIAALSELPKEMLERVLSDDTELLGEVLTCKASLEDDDA